jgi:arsenate reductase
MKLPRVLFVCVGNACRSQMAEGFARTYGKDVMTPESAGVAPAMAVPSETRRTMEEKNIDVSGHSPKPVDIFPPGYFDIVVNLSGGPIPGFPSAIEWKVRDPIGGTAEEYRAARDQIERLVMNLILELRRQSKLVKSADRK